MRIIAFLVLWVIAWAVLRAAVENIGGDMPEPFTVDWVPFLIAMFITFVAGRIGGLRP